MTDAQGLEMLGRLELLWPPLILAVLAITLRSRLSSPFGFAITGVLVFYGLRALIFDVLVQGPLPMIGDSLGDRLLHGVAFAYVRALAAAAIGTIPLLVWLYRSLRLRTRTASESAEGSG